MMSWLLLFLCVSFNALAGLSIKYATQPPFRQPSLQDPMTIIANWPLWFALAFYGSAFLAYAAVLGRMPLSVAGPVVTSGTTLMVAILAITLLREPLRLTTCLGIATIVLGVVLITRN
jgi:small multidrug resistance pump